MDESLVEAVPLSGRDPAFRVELFCDASRGEAIATKLADPRHQFVVAFELTELGDGQTEAGARFVAADPGESELDPFASISACACAPASMPVDSSWSLSERAHTTGRIEFPVDSRTNSPAGHESARDRPRRSSMLMSRSTCAGRHGDGNWSLEPPKLGEQQRSLPRPSRELVPTSVPTFPWRRETPGYASTRLTREIQ
jgi:hypothetical protein